MLREATAHCERATVLWIETWRMVADALTKLLSGDLLRAAIGGGLVTMSKPATRTVLLAALGAGRLGRAAGSP
eukprot:2022240-Lingulodinium_polyedra.AAC.1